MKETASPTVTIFSASAGFQRNIFFINTELINNDSFYFRCNFRHFI